MEEFLALDSATLDSQAAGQPVGGSAAPPPTGAMRTLTPGSASTTEPGNQVSLGPSTKRRRMSGRQHCLVKPESHEQVKVKEEMDDAAAGNEYSNATRKSKWGQTADRPGGAMAAL